MYIPKGWWCVVKRHPRDTRSQGTILKAGLTERTAKYIVAEWKKIDRDNNYWALDEREY
jgi:hypothetical protein